MRVVFIPFSGARVLSAFRPAGVFAAISLSLSAFASEEISPEQLAFFETHIRPVLIESCQDCHDSTGKKQKGGLSLNTPAGLLQGGDSGPALIPGNPDDSLFIEAIRYHNRDLQMPPKTQLSPEKIQRLEEWVTMGAPDPRSNDDHEAPASTMPSLEEGRGFWSFRDLTKPELPASPANESHPIDRFVEDAVSEKGLSLAEPADDASWIRRATYNLIGLPPTPEEVHTFVSSNSPSKHSDTVSRLLDSPQYGVRWGRHWLDVARYADSNGLDENLAFGNAWRYRDYVIDAFNEDKPFDQFLIEQVAGDLVAEPTEETIIATGFLALGARVLAEKDLEKRDMDVIDEQIDTTGKAFLGMTLGCARCHDHKFDPITQADYYSLAAIFKSSNNFAETKTGAISHWFEHSFTREEQEESLKEWDDRIAAAKKETRDFKNQTTVRLRGEAREKAADYLVAATKISLDDTLESVARVAEPAGLHPRILYHSRRHLEVTPDDPAFAKWHEFDAGSDSDEELHTFYHSMFESAVKYEKAKKAKNADLSEFPQGIADYHAALYDNSGFLAVPAKPAHAFSPTDLADYEKLEMDARLLESEAPDHPAAMGIADADEIVAEIPIHIRGSHLNLGDSVARAIPTVFQGEQPEFPEDSSGRLELAHWMADPDNPLTARVIVNRVWRWHFGQGLVETTENFGFLGDQPSHPELLDWLAAWFVENDWSIKKLNQLIMTSDTYRLSTTPPSGAWTTIDPENELLSFFPTNRLDAESIRDSILFISGRLDEEMGGKTIPLRNRQMVFNHTSKDFTRYDSPRRTAYLPVVRNHVYDWLHLFDYPDPTMPTGNRHTTVIAPQALLFMNSPLALESSAAFAQQLQGLDDVEAGIEQAWLMVYSRMPSPDEVEQSRNFIESREDPAAGWAQFCQALFSSNEFSYLQ